jgi:hypothetical protein
MGHSCPGRNIGSQEEESYKQASSVRPRRLPCWENNLAVSSSLLRNVIAGNSTIVISGFSTMNEGERRRWHAAAVDDGDAAARSNSPRRAFHFYCLGAS